MQPHYLQQKFQFLTINGCHLHLKMGNKMKKRILSLVLIILLIFSNTVFAENKVTVILNGEIIETPVEAKLVNDRTMLPMRAIFESMGAVVTWFDADKIIFATKGDKFITLKIGEAAMSVQSALDDEMQIISLDVAPFIDNDHTLVPVRAVAEALDAKVDWEQETYKVIITTI